MSVSFLSSTVALNILQVLKLHKLSCVYLTDSATKKQIGFIYQWGGCEQ